MAIPPFHELFLPTIRFLADGREHDKTEVAAHLQQALQLSSDEVNEPLPSGKQTKFMNRIAWTKTYFTKAGLLESVSRGRFRITQRGLDFLATAPVAMDIHTLKQYPEFAEFYLPATSRQETEQAASHDMTDDETPEERLENNYHILREELAVNVLSQVIQSSPAFFEQLVVDLLIAMGYGGSRADAGKAIGQSGDEGIDGVIKEDQLGLDQIYLQAKRWQNPVGRPQVQHFIGSLVGKSAHKGVMLTTSRFTDEARQFVKHLPQRVVLIDGIELANLMIDFNVGVSPVTTYTVKKLDMDYFEDR